MGRLSRNKGAAFERRVAAALSVALDYRCARRLTESRDGNAGDIDCGDVKLAVQCKTGKTPNVWRAIAEAVAAARPDDVPVAIIHRDGTNQANPPVELAVMRFDDWLARLPAVDRLADICAAETDDEVAGAIRAARNFLDSLE